MLPYLLLSLIFTKVNFEIDGLVYSIYDSENITNSVQIINCSLASNATLEIPPTVTYQSVEYSVISISSTAFSSTNISQFEIINFPYTLIEIEDEAFSNFKNLKSINYINENNELVKDTLPPQITEINKEVFLHCSMLTTIDTNNVNELGKSCFQFCSRLTELTLRNVEIIGPYSLASIQLLQTIELPQKLREIQSYAFAKTSIVHITGEVPNLEVITASFFGCSELITLPKLTGIVQLESKSFSNCIKLKEVHCGSKLSFIYANCFTGCSSLESFTTDSKSYMISMEAFQFCSSLKAFNFSGVTEILNNAFEGCTSLDVIDMSDSELETISPIFPDCGELSAVILPPNLTEFNRNIFEGSNVHSITFTGTKETIDLTGAFFQCEFELFEVIFGPSCSCNFYATFASCYHLGRVVLPTKPFSLYDTFSHCINLTEVVNLEFCNSLDYAFFACEKLTHFDTFPQLTNLGNQTFMDCVSLTSFPVLSSLQIIGKNCFRNCFSLRSFACGDGLTAVGADSFYMCSSLEEFSTSSKSYSIEQVAFCYCSSLKSFDFSRCSKIGFGSFQKCSSLTEIDLSKTNFKSITFLTFSECSSLRNIVFPLDLESVEEDCFSYCESIESLDFASLSPNFTICKKAFQFCIGLKTVKFNTQPFIISEHAFYSCIHLESVYLENPGSNLVISKLEDGCFENCTSLKKFEFEKWSISTIEQYTFYGCPLSKSIKFNDEIDSQINLSISSHAFSSSFIETIDFRFNFGSLDLNEKSFSGCENVKCVMIDTNHENSVSSFFKKKIVNGIHCSNFISLHLTLFVLFIVLAVLLVILIVLIIVFTVKRKRRKQTQNAQPLLATQSISYN